MTTCPKINKDLYVLLQQLESLLLKPESVNGLIPNFNVDLLPIALGWLNLEVRISLFRGCPERVCVHLTLAFWIPCSEPARRTHIPFRVLTGDLSSCNHIVITCLYRGNPAGGPPSQGRPSPRATLPSCGANTQEPAGSWVSVSSLESGERARPRQRPPHSWAHTRAHTPARARRHTRAHAHRSLPRDYLVGGGPAWSGAHSRSPRGRRRPPRPAPPLEPAEPGALWAAKFRGASPQGRRVGSGLARLHGAPDGRDRWPGARAARTDPSARLPPRSTPRPARISAPSAPRAFSPQGWSAASRAPSHSLLLPGFDPSPPPPTMARGPAQTTQLLPLLPLLLLLLRDAGGSHQAPAWSAPPAAADGQAGIKDPWRSPGDAATTLGPGAQEMVAVHMLRLYEKYSRRGAKPGGGNTVRSFRSRLGK